MLRIMADHNIELHLQVLIGICASQAWADVWASLACEVDSFERLGLPFETIDTELWQTCQENGIVLITGNRNADGPTSLEFAIRTLSTDQSLPVLTISDPDRLLLDHRSCARRSSESARTALGPRTTPGHGSFIYSVNSRRNVGDYACFCFAILYGRHKLATHHPTAAALAPPSRSQT